MKTRNMLPLSFVEREGFLKLWYRGQATVIVKNAIREEKMYKDSLAE